MQRINAIEALLKKPAKNFSKEDFHHLRVEIKKVSALSAMLEFSVKKFNSKKVFKPVKKIFRQAGKVRELQLEEAILNKHDPKHKLRTYIRHLYLRESREKKYFLTIYKTALYALVKMYASIIPAIRKVRKNDVKKYMGKNKKKIRILFKSKKLKPAQIHEMRKLLKKLFYNMKSLDLKVNDKTLKNVDSLQELMGEWHDIRLINRHLENAAKKKMAAPLKAKLLELSGKLNLQEQMLYRKIYREKRKRISSFKFTS